VIYRSETRQASLSTLSTLLAVITVRISIYASHIEIRIVQSNRKHHIIFQHVENIKKNILVVYSATIDFFVIPLNGNSNTKMYSVAVNLLAGI